MKTNQRLVWVDKETREPKTWLMMPNEAIEFLDLVQHFGVDFAFERITGQTLENKACVTLKQNSFF